MISWWHYLLLVNLYLVLFFTFYRVFLHKETFFQLNRAYLVAGSVLSFVIPVMQSEWIKNLFITQRVHQTIYATVNPQFIYQVKPVESNPLTLGDIIAWVYIAGAALLLGRLFYQLFSLKRLINRADAAAAFSFFKKIRVDETLPSQQTIIEHEQVHTRQWHSADVLLIEAVMIINWFNPVVYFYRKAIKHVHEYIADRKAIETGTSKTEYALLLLSQTFGTAPHQLTNNFFNNSLLKKRIMMLNQNDSNRRALLKYGLSAPLFAAMLVLSSATVNNSDIVQIINEKTEQAFSVDTEQFKESLNDSISGINAFDGNTSAAKSTVEAPVKSDSSSLEKQPAATTTLTLQVTKDSVAAAGNSPVFSAVELNPTFPGGEENFGRFLVQNIRYPEKAKENKTQGRVFIQFTVEKDGSLSNLKNVRDPGDGLGEEALRVLALSPKWHPGIQNGNTVRVQYTVPVNFSLIDVERKKISDTIRLGAVAGRRISSVYFFKHTDGDSTRAPLAAMNVMGYSNKPVTTIRLNGKVITEEDLKRLSPKNIESIQVIKRDSLNKIPGEGFGDNMILIRAKAIKTGTKG